MPIHQPFMERRNPPDNGAVFFLMQQVHDRIEAMDKRLSEHMRDETLELAEEIAKLMNKAFPMADPEGHRAFHEAQIQAAVDNAEFWKKMRFELAKWGLVGFIGWAVGVIAVAVWAKYFGR